MFIIPIVFRKGLLGKVGRREGRITLTEPGVIRLTQAQVAAGKPVKVNFAGTYEQFPKGLVGAIALVGHTRADADISEVGSLVTVDGAVRGRINGHFLLEMGNQRPVFSFNFCDRKTNHLLDTREYEIDRRVVVSSSAQFMAKITKAARNNHSHGAVSLAVWFEVDKAPRGTAALHLSFTTRGQEYHQGYSANQWAGTGPYTFIGQASNDCAGLLGKPEGRAVKIGAVLRALDGKDHILGTVEDSFSLEEVGAS